MNLTQLYPTCVHTRVELNSTLPHILVTIFINTCILGKSYWTFFCSILTNFYEKFIFYSQFTHFWGFWKNLFVPHSLFNYGQHY